MTLEDGAKQKFLTTKYKSIKNKAKNMTEDLKVQRIFDHEKTKQNSQTKHFWRQDIDFVHKENS